MTIRSLFIFIFLIGSLLSSQAQTTLMSSQVTAQTNDIINLPIKVNGFVNVVGTQFTVKWDPSKVSFLATNGYNLPDLSDGNFGLKSVSNGTLLFSWFQQSLAGVNRENGASLFNLRFKVLGNNTFAAVTIENVPTVIEVVNVNSQVLSVDVQNGGITIGQPNSTTDVEYLGNLGLYQNSPNPFKDFTMIEIEMAKADLATLTIYDKEGKIVFNQKNNFTAGKHTVKIEKTTFPEAGVYFYKLQAGEDIITKRMIFVK